MLGASVYQKKLSVLLTFILCGCGGGGGSSPPAPIVIEEINVEAVEDTAQDFTIDPTGPVSRSAILRILELPANGALSGVFPDLVYTPDADFSGQDVAYIQVTDGPRTSEQVLINFNVTPIDDPPRLGSSPADLDITAFDTLNLSFSATDPDDDTLEFSATGLPDWVNLDTSNGVLSGIPDNHHVGVWDNIAVSVTDGNSLVLFDPFRIEVEFQPYVFADFGLSATIDYTRFNYGIIEFEADPSTETVTVIKGDKLYMGVRGQNKNLPGSPYILIRQIDLLSLELDWQDVFWGSIADFDPGLTPVRDVQSAGPQEGVLAWMRTEDPASRIFAFTEEGKLFYAFLLPLDFDPDVWFVRKLTELKNTVIGIQVNIDNLGVETTRLVTFNHNEFIASTRPFAPALPGSAVAMIPADDDLLLAGTSGDLFVDNNAFVTKVDTDGNRIWMSSNAFRPIDIASLARTNNGDVLLLGNDVPGGDIALVRFSDDGQFVREKIVNVGEPGTDYDLAVFADDEYAILAETPDGRYQRYDGQDKLLQELSLGVLGPRSSLHVYPPYHAIVVSQGRIWSLSREGQLGMQ